MNKNIENIESDLNKHIGMTIDNSFDIITITLPAIIRLTHENTVEYYNQSMTQKLKAPFYVIHVPLYKSITLKNIDYDFYMLNNLYKDIISNTLNYKEWKIIKPHIENVLYKKKIELLEQKIKDEKQKSNRRYLKYLKYGKHNTRTTI